MKEDPTKAPTNETGGQLSHEKAAKSRGHRVIVGLVAFAIIGLLTYNLVG